jgi:hypothetical protein
VLTFIPLEVILAFSFLLQGQCLEMVGEFQYAFEDIRSTFVCNCVSNDIANLSKVQEMITVLSNPLKEFLDFEINDALVSYW